MTPLQRILKLLDHVRETEKGYLATCPAHEDQNPSLKIDQGDDGRVLLHCHAGCSVEAITDAIGVRMRDLFHRSDRKDVDGGGRHKHPENDSNIRMPSRKQAESRGSAHPRNRSTDAVDSKAQPAPSSGLTLEEYAQQKRLPIEFLRDLGLSQIYLSGVPAVLMPYRDEVGMAVGARFRVAMEGDRFRWRRKAQLCLYGLWRLSEMRSSPWVVLVEGESDAQTLWRYRISALGLPGASTWREAWAPFLDSFEVIYVVIEPGASGEAMLQWLKTSAIRNRVRLVRLEQYKDPSALHLDSPQAFEDRWQAALAASTPWVDEAEAERSREVAVQYALAKALLEDPQLLEKIGKVMQQRGYAGDVTPAKIVYVALTSRLLERPQNVGVVAPSAAGKNRAVDEALALIPPEAVYVMKAGSPRALIYSDDDFHHRVIVVAEADSIPEDGPAATAIRSLAADNYMAYDVVEKNPKTGRFETRHIEKPGPTGLITTSTKSLGEQLGTRVLEVPVRDDEAQTRAVMKAHARTVAPGKASPPDLAPFLALQRWLALQGTQRVMIPFAEILSDLLPAKAVHMRRDFRQLLTCIQAMALLYQCQREKTEDGAIIATLDDYCQARDLLAPIFDSIAAGGITPAVRDTVEAVQPGEEISATVLVQRLKLSKATVHYRVNRAIAGGWLINRETRAGCPAKLARGAPLPEVRAVLPTRDEVAAKVREEDASKRSSRTNVTSESIEQDVRTSEISRNGEVFEGANQYQDERDPPAPPSGSKAAVCPDCGGQDWDVMPSGRPVCMDCLRRGDEGTPP